MIFPTLHLSNNLKKKKRNININLAVLPSHDIMCCAPVSGREVGRIFWSDGSHQDRGSKEASEGVGVDKMRLGPDDVNLQTEEIHCNYLVLIGSPE